MSLIWFLIGSGLVMLGAFFLWRLVGNKPLGLVVGVMLPLEMVAVLAAAWGYGEMAAGVLLGAVAFNYGLIGLLNLCYRMHYVRVDGLMSALWVALGLGACWVSRHRGCIGMFSGWGLVTVGLVAVWQMLSFKTTNHQHEIVTNEVLDVKNQVSKSGGQIWHWVVLLGAVVLLGIGTWLVVLRHAALVVVLKLPESLVGAVVVAPLCGFTILFGLRMKKRWQAENLLFGLTRGNALLATVGLGLVAVLNGGLPLTQSTLLVTLPWAAGLMVVSVVSVYLPQKTARWWGGLMVAMYLGYLISLLW